MSLIKKYNISEEDLYKLSCIEKAKIKSSFFQKEKLKSKSLGILKPYNIKFLDIGDLVEELAKLELHSDTVMIEKYDKYDIDDSKSSMGLKYIIPIFIGFFLIAYFVTIYESDNASSNNIISTEECKDNIRAYQFGREMAHWSSMRGGMTLSKAIDEFNSSMPSMTSYTADDGCVKRGYEDVKAGKENPYKKE